MYAKFQMIDHATVCNRILGTQESSVVKCQRCFKTLLEIQNENNYSDHGLLRSWERHMSNCDGTHYDKVYEAFVAMFGDNKKVNKKGHKKTTHGSQWM
jgi:adenosine deaminase